MPLQKTRKTPPPRVVSTEPQLETVPLSALQQDPKNANLGTPRGQAMLAESMEQVGMARSIVTDRHGTIIAGNKTQQQAMERGIEEAVIVHTQGDKLVVVQRDDLDLTRDDPNNPARRLAYYDNRVSEVDLSWNRDVLLADLDAGMDFKSLFDDDEVRYLRLLAVEPNAPLGMTPGENLDVYLDTTIRQIVLLFDLDTYDDVLRRLMAVRKREGVETNTDAVLRLLEAYENAARDE